MEVIVHTAEEVRQVCHSSTYVIRNISRVKAHDEEKCGCDYCQSFRLLREVVQRLGSVTTK